ncbi:MAG: hypothetical protein ACR2L8_14395, partial [Solirubrobacteraceae bacterium]
PEAEAVETLADDDTRVHAGTGPAAAAEADEDTAKPRRRRRSRSSKAAPSEVPPGGEGEGVLKTRDVTEGEDEERAARPAGETDPDDAVQSKPRRRGRRGGRRRSRADADGAEVSEASE